METIQSGAKLNWKRDIRSKVLDGILAGWLLLFLLVVLRIIVDPIGYRFGRLGLLNYDVFLIALAVFCLERALSARRADTTLAWLGAVGGLLTWSAVELSCLVGQTPLVALTGVMLFILILLIVFVLWRKGLSIGGKFYMMVVLICWLAKYILASQEFVRVWLPAMSPDQHLVGFFALLGAVVVIGWILFQSQRRLERTWAALWLFFFSMLALGSFFPFLS
ncbi:MAG: hypothetical protein GYA48_03955 [Chloroflexi bacterium]|nr:hypothetical protein [Chloroflexota bacterium]